MTRSKSKRSNESYDSSTQMKRKRVDKKEYIDSSSDDDLDFIPHEADLNPKFSYEDFLKYCAHEDKALISQRRKKKKVDIDDDLNTTKSSSDEDSPSKLSSNKRMEETENQSTSKVFKSREEMREKKKREKERLTRTVYVGNLAPTVNKKSMTKLFSDCGDIESIRIRGAVPVQGGIGRTARKLAMISKEFSGGEEHRLYAYVVFKSVDSISKALLLNNTELSERKIRVDIAGKVSYEANNCVFIGNIPFNSTEEEVRKEFESCGEIINVHLIRDRAVGAVKGFGYVEFSQPTSVTLALKHSGSATIKGRKVRVERFSKKPKKSDTKSKKSKNKNTVKNDTQPTTKNKNSDKNNRQPTKKKHRLIIPTNLKGNDVPKYIRNKQKKIDKKKKRLANKKANK